MFPQLMLEKGLLYFLVESGQVQGQAGVGGRDWGILAEGGGGGPGLVEAQLLLVIVPGVVVLARVEVGVSGRRPGRGRLVVVVGAGGAALGVGHPRLVPRGVLLLLSPELSQ